MNRSKFKFTAARVSALAMVLISAPRAVGDPAETIDNDTWEAARLASLLVGLVDADGDKIISKDEMAAAKRLPALKGAEFGDDGSITHAALAKFYINRLAEVDGEARRNIRFKEVGAWRGLLDVYMPLVKTGDRAPVLVFIHGGGWTYGDKRRLPITATGPIMRGVREAGFVAVSIDYRLVRVGGGEAATVRDCAVDCKDALRFLKKSADDFGIDADRLVVFGESAGAHLAMLATLSAPDAFRGEPALAGYDVAPIACVSWYGPTDMQDPKLFDADEATLSRRMGERFSAPGTPAAQQAQRMKELSPVEYLKKTSPPLLLVHGDKDVGVPVHHAPHMERRARELGAPAEMLIIHNAGHNWRQVGPDPIEPSLEEIQRRTVEFIVRAR